MFVAATWTGTMLWHLFVKLDSDRYPIRTYGDIAERIYGPWARHLCTVLASVQLIVNVGLIALGAGQALSQVSKASVRRDVWFNRNSTNAASDLLQCSNCRLRYFRYTTRPDQDAQFVLLGRKWVSGGTPELMS